jgi:large subunit ribosomal protein L23
MTLIRPVITEKSMMSASIGQFTFAVLLGSSKHQVKQAVETAFKVNVTSINILRRHVPAKGTGSKRLVGNAGQVKFATVTLKKGQKIELFDLKEEK